MGASYETVSYSLSEHIKHKTSFISVISSVTKRLPKFLQWLFLLIGKEKTKRTGAQVHFRYGYSVPLPLYVDKWKCLSRRLTRQSRPERFLNGHPNFFL